MKNTDPLMGAKLKSKTHDMLDMFFEGQGRGRGESRFDIAH
jgi:hypothetical protein